VGYVLAWDSGSSKKAGWFRKPSGHFCFRREKPYFPRPPLAAEPCPLDAEDAAAAVLEEEDMAGEEFVDIGADEIEVAVPVEVPDICE